MRLQFKNKWAHRLQAVLRRRGETVTRGSSAYSLPTFPANEAWDEAFLRVESYLRAHHIQSRVLLNRRTTEILDAARRLAADHPNEAPVTVAMQVAQARMGEWLVHTLGEGDWADERFRARGRLALLLAEIPEQHPEHFLGTRELPKNAIDRLRTAELRPGPGLKLTSMPPAPLEFPLGTAVEEKWVTFSRSTAFRASTSWLVIIGFLSVAWFATH
jgi:hypothetical protein